MPSYKSVSSATGKASWFCQFYYTDWTGTRKKKKKRGFSSKHDADAWERSFLEKQSASASLSFSSLISLYMEDCAIRMKPTSVYRKRCTITHRILPFFSKFCVSDITPAHVRAWQNHLISSTRDNAPAGASLPLSVGYLRSLNNELSAIFNFAMRFYGLPSNPVRLCGQFASPVKSDLHYWKVEDFKRFIAGFNDDPVFFTFFHIIFGTGCRVGEVLALSVSDFDFEKRMLHISKSLSRLHGKDFILTPKTPYSIRDIPLPSYLCEIVKEYISLLHPSSSSSRLFEMVTYNNALRVFRIICEQTGVPRIRIHDLRHSHASLLIDMGFSPVIVRDRLGHSSINTTINVYSHLYPDSRAKVADKLSVVMEEEKG